MFNPISLSCTSTAARAMMLSDYQSPSREINTTLTFYASQVHRLIAPRDQKYQSNFVEFRPSTKIVYRRYAGLFFCVCVDANDNELAYLEAIHFFVEVLDQFFGNVCELDLVFNFYKVGLSRKQSKSRAVADEDGCRSMRFSTRCFWQERSKRQVNRLS